MAIKVAIIQGKAPSGGVGGATESDLSAVTVDFISPGARDAASFRIDPPGSSIRQVTIKAGRYYAPNAAGTMVYVVDLDADATLNLATNPSGNPRISAIVLKLDRGTTPNNLADNIGSLVEVQGTAAASPVAPNDAALQSDVGAGNVAVRLANITLSAGYTTVTAPNISNTRLTAAPKLTDGQVTAAKRSEVVKVGTFTTTANGAQAITGLGFKPKAVMFIMVSATHVANTVANSVIGFSDGVTSASNGFRAQESGDIAGSVSSTFAAFLPGGNSAQQNTITLTSLDADGFTVTVGSFSANTTYAYMAFA